MAVPQVRREEVAPVPEESRAREVQPELHPEVVHPEGYPQLQLEVCRVPLVPQ